MRVIVVAIAIAIPVSAQAPADQYEQFIGADPTVTDNYTGLTWDRPISNNNVGAVDSYPAARSLFAAQQFCAAKSMRLPSLKELFTIFDEQPHDQYVIDHNEKRYLDLAAFKNTPKGEFWSSSFSDDTHAYTFDFFSAAVQTESTATAQFVRCVD